jgi:hypothetical protein
MLDLIGKLGIAGGFGFVIGIVMVLWVEPTTNGGTAILIVISVIVCATVGGIISALQAQAKPPEDDKSTRKGDNSFGQ